MDTPAEPLPSPAPDTHKPKRRMRSYAEKREIVEATLVEGASVAAVARQFDMNANQLFSWRRLYQQGRLDQAREPSGSKLLPVQVLPAGPDSQPRGQPETTPTAQIEIVLPNRVVLRVDSRVDAARLATVLAVVQAQ